MNTNFDAQNFFDVSHLTVASVVSAMKVGGRTDEYNDYTFHFLLYKRIVEAKMYLIN